MNKKEKNRTRKIPLHIMISDTENQMIEERMQRCGYQNKSEYARRMMIDGGILVVDDADEIRRLNFEISKIGNNNPAEKNSFLASKPSTVRGI